MKQKLETAFQTNVLGKIVKFVVTIPFDQKLRS
mgnify:CR=1 FL=1